jgi:serine/threonine protein kinase
MDFLSLNCPQCGGLLPRAARWRTVGCPYCGAMVTRSEHAVEAGTFHESWLRARAAYADAGPTLTLGKSVFLIRESLGRGDSSEIFLALRLDSHRERVVIRRCLAGDADGGPAREFAALTGLQALQGPGAAYYSLRIPEAVAFGRCADTGRETLVTRPIPGCWGTLLDVMRRQPHGIDPRHGVWIWRRILETLDYLHANGWAHGDVHPGHVLVQPKDHGAFLIGWGKSRPRASSRGMADDLVRSAWCIRALLHGMSDTPPGFGTRTPPAFTRILRQVGEDAVGNGAMNARAIDTLLKAAAREDFGPPAFVHFDPNAA